MTPDEVKQSLTGWCSGDDYLQYTGDQSEAGADFAFGVRATGEREGPVELQVLHQGGDRITIRHIASISSSSADSAQKLLDQRPGWVMGSVDRSGNGGSAVVQTFVYLDGLNKNSFVHAASEVARSARLLGGLTTSAATVASVSPVPSPSPSPQPSYTPAPQPVPSAQPVGAPSFNPQPQQTYTPAPQPVQGPGPWVPTHSVPPQGLRAWSSPDPAGPVVANLAPGLPIQVAEVRGAWARVICSNGWVGWIDGRLIGVAA